MGNTYKKQARKFDDEQYSGRSGKQANHANNHKFGGLQILNAWVDEAEFLELPEDDVDSGINKQ
jgi:hypothetical protein